MDELYSKTGTRGIDSSLQGNIFESVFFNNPPPEMNLYALNKRGSSTAKIISNVTKSIRTPKDKHWPNSEDFKTWESNVLYIPVLKH